MCLGFGDQVFVETIGYVVFDGEGVEEGGLLKDHADSLAELEEIDFAHAADLVVKDGDGPRVGFEETVRELEEDGFTAACGTEDDAGLALADSEGDVVQDGFDVEGDGDVLEDDDGLCERGCG